MSLSLSRPTRRPERLLVLGSVLTAMLIIAIVAVLLIREHANTLEAAQRTASNITQLIDTDVARNVELYDMALKGLIAATGRTDLQGISADIRHLVLFDRSAAAPFKGDILLLDARGEVMADSSLITPRPATLPIGIISRHTATTPKSVCISAAPSSRAACVMTNGVLRSADVFPGQTDVSKGLR